MDALQSICAHTTAYCEGKVELNLSNAACDQGQNSRYCVAITSSAACRSVLNILPLRSPYTPICSHSQSYLKYNTSPVNHWHMFDFTTLFHLDHMHLYYLSCIVYFFCPPLLHWVVPSFHRYSSITNSTSGHWYVLLFFLPCFCITFCSPLFQSALSIWHCFFPGGTSHFHLNIPFCFSNCIVIGS